MKILLVHCHYRLPGGEDAVFAAERELLERHGHTVLVYERSNEEAAHGAAKALLPLHAVWNRRAAREVKDLIKREGVEAVHIHNTLLLLSPAVVRAAKSCGVPVVQTLHNFRLFCPNGILLRDGQVCEECPHQGLHCALKHSCYRGSKAQTLVVVAAYWLHRVLGTWRGVTMAAPTEFDREKLLEFNKIHPMFDANRLVVKPNPVCVPNGPVTPWDERKRQFVFAGRLEELKGIRTVIEAWRILGKNAPELLVAGDGPLAPLNFCPTRHTICSTEILILSAATQGRCLCWVSRSSTPRRSAPAWTTAFTCNFSRGAAALRCRSARRRPRMWRSPD